MLEITLARSDSDHGWKASIVTADHQVIWAAPERFDSADQAYYRAMGEYVLRVRDRDGV